MTEPTHDHELLLGVLALRNGLVDRQALARALAEWRADPAQPFAAVLARHGRLSADDLAALETMRRLALGRNDDQAGRTLDALDATDPALADLRNLPTLDLPTPAAAPDTEVFTPAAATPTGRRFRVVRFHKGGGLGEVFVAHDEELGRDVALKQIRPDRADNAGDRASFLREAQLTGLLEHPGVVPVYGLGTDADGRPFYAMRFIEGEELTAAIARYHAPGPDEAQRRVALRELLRRFIEVCNTIAYAHSRGVVHRDLKPANIMLGRYGETLVVDWGLAKEVRSAEDGTRNEDAATFAADETLAGQIKGTLAYMAPEQAEGRADLVGPACDVYGLGATLFYLLTGQPPFQGSVRDVLLQVSQGQVPRLRDLRRDVPAALEAVCLKAMALRPEDRYATATELAEDVARWLADEPPRAYAEPWAERLTRLARRYRTATVASALALVAVSLVSLVALFFVNQARTSEARAFALNTTNRDLADALRAADWDEAHLDRIDALVADLGRLDPAAVPGARERVHEALAEAIGANLRAGTLTEDLQRRTAGLIAALAEREPGRAAGLRADFARRLRAWEVVFSLDEPFGDLEAVFDPARVRDAGAALRLAGGARPEGPLVRTRRTAAGNVALEATFEPSWQKAPLVGLALQAGPTGGYRFVVGSFEYTTRAAQDLDRRDPLETALKAGERVYVAITRDGLVLARTQLAVPAGSLKLRAQREGSRVEFQVGELPPLTFEDSFALPGGEVTFGLLWPNGPGLTRLRALRQALPQAPSPLERGDDLFGRRQYDEALTFYEQFARQAGDPTAAAQARFKVALCLYELGRSDEASERLRRLKDEEQAGPWRLRARARLWLWALLAGQDREAQQLLAEFPPGITVADLASIVPAELRNEAIDTLRLRGPRWRSVYGTAREIEQLRQAIRVEEIFNESAFERRQTQWKLCDELRAQGRTAEARLLLAELLRQDGMPPDEHVAYLRDQVWMQIEAGQIAEARAAVEAALRTHSAPEYLALHLERARLYAAEKKWALAEQAVADYLEKVRPGEGHYADYADACLLRGFFRLEQGDADGAREAWRAGLLRHWPGGLPVLPRGRLPSGLVQDRYTTGNNFNMLLSSLTGEMTEGEAQAYLTHLTTGTGASRTALDVLTKQNFPIDFVRQVLLGNCAEPRGRDIARRMAYRQIDFRGFYLEPFQQSIAVAFKVGAITGPVSAELDALIWAGSKGLFKAYDDGRLDVQALRDMLRLWHGQAEAPAETWARLAPKLEPDLRIPGAYLFGRRYLVLKRPADARAFLQEAAATTQAEFKATRQLAQEELRKLDP